MVFISVNKKDYDVKESWKMSWKQEKHVCQSQTCLNENKEFFQSIPSEKRSNKWKFTVIIKVD